MPKWYGYKHISGTVHVHKVFSQTEMDEARKSEDVVKIYGPWECESRHDAANKTLEAMKGDE